MKLINKLIDALAKLFTLINSDVTPSYANTDRYNTEISKTKITARLIANELLYRYKNRNHFIGKISVGVALFDAGTEGCVLVVNHSSDIYGSKQVVFDNKALSLSLDDFSSRVLSKFDEIKEYKCDSEAFFDKYEKKIGIEWSYSEI